MRKTQVGAIVFRKHDNKIEYLLLKRIPKKGGFWQYPSGGLEEEDNSLVEAAKRELKEETGITDEIIRIYENVYEFTIDKHYLTGKPILPITEHILGFMVKGDVTITFSQNIYPEHEQFSWVLFDKAIEMLKWENNKKSLIAFNNQLTKQ